MIKFFYDLETTGVDFRKNSIIQLYCEIYDDEKFLASYEYFMRPHPKAIIEPSALKANNRTEEEIMQYPLMYSVQQQFKQDMSQYVDRFNKLDKMVMIGYNNRNFDDNFMRKWFELCSDNFFGSFFHADSIDVICLASEYLLDRRKYMPSFKLFRVAKELGIVVDESELHDAKYDVKLTKQIYDIVTRRIAEPAKQFYFYNHEGSDALFKTFEPIEHDGDVDELSFDQFRAHLRRLNLEDDETLIQDDLM